MSASPILVSVSGNQGPLAQGPGAVSSVANAVESKMILLIPRCHEDDKVKVHSPVSMLHPIPDTVIARCQQRLSKSAVFVLNFLVWGPSAV